MQYKIVMLYGQTPLRTVRTLARADDVAAMLAAKNLLERATRCVAVEVWDGERRIGLGQSHRTLTRRRMQVGPWIGLTAVVPHSDAGRGPCLRQVRLRDMWRPALAGMGIEA
jgi:hypothetical protein